MAKNKVRTLDFYGFDGDNTMLRGSDYFPISDVKEIENRKYIKSDDESNKAEVKDVEVKEEEAETEV